ncbi:hypothetical protein [Marinomonas sp. IMCC 4694]|uniref:hypothetical protein n=1 Tax=Marinomonas sp. IMCC 4694 TaxID=2605432 RepID=UPI0011E6415B|nr:hypothetical protein [Marinomonas sp. IMCC 4694]TYL49014.1 hypothetical protein FXV75_14420 [Marinomonas sp. IMCC 4694]
MKLTPNDAVAVYSARQCSLHAIGDAFESVKQSAMHTDPPPDADRLLTIQKSVQPKECLPKVSRLVIVVPDRWLSVSQHSMGSLVPPSLLPMAALSYAVETTFSPPETLLFTYQQTVLVDKQAHLTVLACSIDWADQLRVPFQGWAETMFILSVSQWLGMKAHSPRLVGAYCQRNALQVYQPKNNTRHKTRRLWGVLILLSAFVNGLAGAYWIGLQHRSDHALILRDTYRQTQDAWLGFQQIDDFSSAVLVLLKSLPNSVRLMWVKGDASSMAFQMTVSEQELDRLLPYWQQQYPEWQWKVSSLRSALSVSNQQEVMDVSVSVSQRH